MHLRVLVETKQVRKVDLNLGGGGGGWGWGEVNQWTDGGVPFWLLKWYPKNLIFA